MSDIYNVLSKHFVGETTPEEQLLVEQFKLENPKEYHALQTFWTQKDLNLAPFDTAQGWQKVALKAKGPRRVFLYPSLRRVAAIAAVFLITVAGVYLFNHHVISTELVTKTAAIQNERIELEDGSIIYLNKEARIIFPEKFGSEKRELSLQGEAFFEIAKDANRPFIVHTIHSDVEVLGTSFNINTINKKTEISVATGKVKVQSLNSKEISVLIPNQSVLVTDQKMQAFSTNNQNYLAWKTGVFHFNKATLPKVVKELNRYYGDKIILSKQEADCLFSSSFNQQDLSEIMEIIKLSCELQLQQKNGVYELF